MTRVIWTGSENAGVADDIMSRRRRRRNGRRKDAKAARPWRAVAVVFLVAALSTGAWSMRVNEIEISGFGLADRARAQQMLQPALEQRWLLVDAEDLARSLETDPWIDRARVSRALPMGLKVHLEEARPCYRLENGDAVDGDARVLPAPEGLELSQLPLLEGVVVDAASSLGSATSVVRDLSMALREVSWTWPTGIERIVVGSTSEVELVTGEGTRIQLGRREFRRRLQRLGAVQERLEDMGESIDLRFARQVVIGNAIPSAGD